MTCSKSFLVNADSSKTNQISGSNVSQYFFEKESKEEHQRNFFFWSKESCWKYKKVSKLFHTVNGVVLAFYC